MLDDSDPASDPQSGSVYVEYWTDPLCCWSWAMEPHWRQFLAAFGGCISWRYRMGGMITDWTSYQDPVLSVSRPAQMGPVWMQARHVTGAEIDDRVWVTDPPSSSLPACAAVKTAELQGRAAGDRYLRCLREVLMREGKNIARPEVLMAAAERAAAEESGGFDLSRFLTDYGSDEARVALREDLMIAKYREIGRFPTLVFHGTSGTGLMVVGYRPYEALVAVYRATLSGQVVPEAVTIGATTR